MVVIGVLVAYAVLRKRLGRSELRRRFALIPLASLSLGISGVWLSLGLTRAALYLGP